MFSTKTYTQRREQLQKQIPSGVLLFLGNNDVGMNYKDNVYRFRQDSNFLYFFGIDQPGLAAVIDLEENQTIIFGDELTVEDIVWTGPHPTLASRAARVGVAKTLPSGDLSAFLKKAIKDGRTVHFTPPYRHDNMLLLSGALKTAAPKLKEKSSVELIKAIVTLRSHKSEVEVAEMERAVNITGAMHVAVMRAVAAGKKESQLAGIAQGIATGMGGDISYGIILTVNGQTLHNHYHGNTMKEGQLVLGDFGAETAMHYAGDITRTLPVAKKFTQQQREIYDIVLDAEVSSIELCKPGITYKEVHLAAARRMAGGLAGLGLMKGDPGEAVAQGAHALFFPHGLGHMLGLDVHDMEDLGEQYTGYSEGMERSTQFGTAYLRLARALEPGFVLTVEPGIYFIPELIDQWKAAGKFTDFINYDKLGAYRRFGGVRTEDNVLITENGHRILGKPIPKTADEVEALRN